MIFDLFHSISDPVVHGKSMGPKPAIEAFLKQAELAESLGIDTVWLAESHFSSEIQKKTSVATIPNFFGEVGLNCDSFQFFHLLASRTKKINFGTGVHNIVGGSGGPIASADRVNFLNFVNQNLWNVPRTLRIGVAAGRFPYQNTPFGIHPRNQMEQDYWPDVKRYIFLEALEIFLRLLRGEVLGSSHLSKHAVMEKSVEPPHYISISPRWEFEPLKLVPEVKDPHHLRVVLGSGDPLALELAYRFWEVDLFNLSFTPPDQIEKLHEKMKTISANWNRSRLPRTVLVFIDRDRKKAQELSHFVLDAYIEAMRGTANVPDKRILLERALVGDASEIRDQLSPDNPRRFHSQDRLMLWFEFNQVDGEAIYQRMKYFFEGVVSKLPC